MPELKSIYQVKKDRAETINGINRDESIEFSYQLIVSWSIHTQKGHFAERITNSKQ